MTAAQGEATALVDLLDGDALVAVADRLAAACRDGMAVDRLIDDVLRPVMVEVGQRWESNRWTVGQEHGATATIDAALAAVEGRYLAPARGGRRIVVACAEGEWHALPARLAALRLRGEGANVVFLGPSLPAVHLGAHLKRIGAGVLGLSCTMAVHLAGARRSIAASHAVGVPVIVGGAAFATTSTDDDPFGRRATAVGADAVSGPDNAAFLDAPRLRSSRSSRIDTRNRQEAADLDVAGHDVVSAAMAELALAYRPMRAFDGDQRARTREDLAWIVRFCGAAIDVADPSVLSDFLVWVQRVLAARHVPEQALERSLESLQVALAPQFPHAARLLADAPAQVPACSTSSDR
jgi:methanogenic corrinoid protein MtbC1